MDGFGLELYEYLKEFIGNPLILSLILFFSTFVLEDAATVSAALLSSHHFLPPLMGFSAILLGILIGDVGLYGLGFLANHFAWARKLQEKRKVHAVHDWLQHRLFLAVVAARFIPGARLTTFATIGFFKLSFTKYMAAVLLASVLWSSILFYVVYSYGMAVMDQFGAYRWAIAGGLVFLIFFFPRIMEMVGRK